MASLLGARRSAGLIIGLEPIVGSLKTLLPALRFPVSLRHACVACSIALRFKHAMDGFSHG